MCLGEPQRLRGGGGKEKTFGGEVRVSCFFMGGGGAGAEDKKKREGGVFFLGILIEGGVGDVNKSIGGGEEFQWQSK